jgi:hypothetical protein
MCETAIFCFDSMMAKFKWANVWLKIWNDLLKNVCGVTELTLRFKRQGILGEEGLQL